MISEKKLQADKAGSFFYCFPVMTFGEVDRASREAV